MVRTAGPSFGLLTIKHCEKYLLGYESRIAVPAKVKSRELPPESPRE
jgi:hypothetical protein